MGNTQGGDSSWEGPWYRPVWSKRTLKIFVACIFVILTLSVQNWLEKFCYYLRDRSDAIVVATFVDWLKNLVPVFQPMRTKTNLTSYTRFFPRFELQVFGRNSDWLILLFACVVIGRSNDFGIDFSTVMLSQTTLQFNISFQTAMENSSLWCLSTNPSFIFSSPFGLSFSCGMTKA